MKYYPFLMAIVLCHTPLFSIEKREELFSIRDIQMVLNRADQKEDLIVLNDGTQLNGKIPKFPQLHFSFGSIPINIDDGAAIAFCHLNGKEKMQVITRDGYRLVGEMPHERIVLVQSFPSVDHPSYTTEQEIDPRTIHRIFFKKRREARAHTSSSSSLHTLSLKNGDQIPIIFAEDHIPLSNGWKDFSLRTDDVVSLNFDGGLHGKLEDCQGSSMELDYAFVKDKYLHVQIAGGTQKLGISWEQIVSIHKERPLPSYAQGVGINLARREIQDQQRQGTIDGQNGKILVLEEGIKRKAELQIGEEYPPLLGLDNQIDKLKHLLAQEKERSQNMCSDLEKTIGERQCEIEQMQLTYGELYTELISQITTQKEQIQTLRGELCVALAKGGVNSSKSLGNQSSRTQEEVEECGHDEKFTFQTQ